MLEHSEQTVDRGRVVEWLNDSARLRVSSSLYIQVIPGVCREKSWSYRDLRKEVKRGKPCTTAQKIKEERVRRVSCFIILILHYSE